MVCWVEPSAQNSIYISNNPSHKKPTELNSYLSWPARNLRAPTRRLRGLSDWPFYGWCGWYIYHTHSPPTVIFSIPSSLSNRSSLSQAWCSQLPCSNLCDSLRDLALESVRKLVKILLLHSCALGEALAAWCVHYSWSLAPRWLAIAR
jgi:hypothetical protein